MPLLDINLTPSQRQLRQFGVVTFVVLPLIGWVWGTGVKATLVMAMIGFAIAVMGWLKPRVISPLFVALMLAAAPIGLVVGELSMLAIYGLIFVPLGLLFRIFRRDPLRRHIDQDKETYWESIAPVTDVSSYYRQS